MISIVIPTYLQRGYGPRMLTKLLDSIAAQKYVNYEVCISDNDTTGKIKEVAYKYTDRFNLSYYRNPVQGASENINSAIDMANFKLIKLMCQDDLLLGANAVELFANKLSRHGWVISNSVYLDANGRARYRKRAQYNHDQFKTNITGMPSVIGWQKCDLRFDPRLKTFCDMYFYYQLYQLYGQPGVIDSFVIGQRFWHGSQSRNQEPSHDEDREFLRANKMIHC